MARDYRKIVAWRRAHALTLAIYQRTKDFPRNEIYGLTSQLRRAACSVAANISEGSGRDTSREFLRFLTIARASLKETEYFLLLAGDLGYLTEKECGLFTESVNRAFASLHGLIEAVRKEATPGKNGNQHRSTTQIPTVP